MDTKYNKLQITSAGLRAGALKLKKMIFGHFLKAAWGKKDAPEEAKKYIKKAKRDIPKDSPGNWPGNWASKAWQLFKRDQKKKTNEGL